MTLELDNVRHKNALYTNSIAGNGEVTMLWELIAL